MAFQIKIEMFKTTALTFHFLVLFSLHMDLLPPQLIYKRHSDRALPLTQDFR
jgi:hypothetical protein